MDPIDEVYYSDQETEFPQYVPLLPIRSPREAAARRPSVYAPLRGAAAGDPGDPMNWDPNDPARVVLSGLLAQSDAGELNDQRAPPRLNQFAPARRRQPPTEEQQWGRLNNREKRAIRITLQQIPCHVTHASELGMMRLINRFRSRRRSGGAKRQQNKKSKSSKRSKSHKRMHH
jgi:hypothetical protein